MPENATVGGQPLLIEGPRDAEVGHLGRALLVDQHVLGLHVAVHDVARVRGAQGAGDLDRVGDRLGDRQAALAPDAVLERLALDVFEDDVRAPLVLARVDNTDDVGVRELGHGARLAAKALELIRVGRHLTVHELDRDLALQRLVERAVDRRHAARTDPGLKPVAPAEDGAEERAHCARLYFEARMPALSPTRPRPGTVTRPASDVTWPITAAPGWRAASSATTLVARAAGGPLRRSRSPC